MPNNCSENSSCPEDNNSPIVQLDASQIFYHFACPSGESLLTTLDLSNGVNLEQFMESVDEKLNQTVAFNYSAYQMDCLKKRYTVLNISNFIDAMDGESCRLDSAFQLIQDNTKDIATLNGNILDILNPKLVNNCNIPFTANTPLAPAIQAFVTHYCNFVNTLVIPESPSIVGLNNSTIAWSLAGVKNHNLTASVKVSTDADNAIEIHTDGLYAALPSTPASYQTLNWDAMSSTLSISNGNSQIINFPGAQVLSNPSGSILSLSGGGGSIDIATMISLSFTETVLAVSSINAALSIGQSGTSQHTLALGLVLDSTTAGNIGVINSYGLYIPKTSGKNGLNNISNTEIGLGGTLLTDTEIILATKQLKITDSDVSSDFVNNGFNVYKNAGSLQKHTLTIESDLIKFKSGNTANSTAYDYLNLKSFNGSSVVLPRLFIGVANNTSDFGNGSRFNVDSSMGIAYVSSTAATFTLNENHLMYIYKGQSTPAAQDLTLPDPSTSTGLGSGKTAWVLCIKNFSDNVADVINTNYDIYLDETNLLGPIANGTTVLIAAVDGKWIKIN